MTITRRTIIITGKMLGADTDAEHHVSVSKAPWEHSSSVSLAGPRPEVEPRRKGIMQHPAPRCHPLVAAAIEAMQ